MNRITIKVEGIEPEQVGYGVIADLAHVFEECLNLVAMKSTGYGDAWRRQGWMGNLARVMSKTARLKNLLWKDMPSGDPAETPSDTLLDQINLSGFMLINLRRGNRWGEERG